MPKEDEENRKLNAAAEEEDDEAEESEDDDKADKVPSDCKACGIKNETDAKYCKGCGAALSTKPAEDDGAPEEPPPSSKPGQAPPAAPPGHHPPPPERMNANASLAAILGASSDSIPALKSAAIKLRQVRDAAIGVTGKTSTDGIIGALLSMPERLAAGERAAVEHKEQQRKAAKRERWALAKRLVLCKAPGRERGRVFLDEVGADGKRKAIGLTPEYAEMRIGTFRALVEGLEKTAPRETPFQPDREDAKRRSDAAAPPQAGGAPFEPSAAQLKALESHPTVYQMQRRGSALTPAKLVNGLVATYPNDARAWLKAQGVSK